MAAGEWRSDSQTAADRGDGLRGGMAGDARRVAGRRTTASDAAEIERTTNPARASDGPSPVIWDVGDVDNA